MKKIILPAFVKKLNYYRFLPWLLLILIFFFSLYLGNFLNQNYFIAKKSLEKINQLSDEVSPLTVDIQTYNKIMANSEKRQKAESRDFSQIKNPFLDNNAN